MKVVANWKESLAFDVVSDNGHQIRVDTIIENGSLNSGMSPKKLILAGLCGCSGMDVVDILTKMKVAFTKVTISAEAEQVEEHPKVFKSIQMVYQADVTLADLDKLTRAVALSQEKYCGVSAMLEKHCSITYSIELI
jgi:putative redox protein